MTSTVNSMPATSNATSGNASAQTPGGRPSLRSSASTRISDGRRQSGSPLDGPQRRSNSQKAWTSGTNPITQRSSYSQQNGNLSQKQSPSPRPSPKESNTPDNHAHDRLVFLLTSCIGSPGTISSKTTNSTNPPEKYTGIFSSLSVESHGIVVILKMVQQISASDQPRANGVSESSSPFIGAGPEHSMSFDISSIEDLFLPAISTSEVIAKGSNGASSGFRTDADISGNLAMRERTLKRWEPSADTDVDLSLETADTTGWDQFEANKRLFGATSSYDENIYTTRIDRSDPTYRVKEAEAARIAREIEGTDIDNAHVREERGLVSTEGGDEEDKYSGVRRDDKAFPPLVSGQPNKYTPPARRQAAAQAAPSPIPTAPAPKAQSSNTTPPAQTQPQQTPTPSTESDPKPAAPSKAPVTTAAAPRRTGAENTKVSVETEVLDHFRQFATNEKIKFQERRRNQASHDRTIKLNELMKFSQNFKLDTPVPKDLVPILAKDPHKQEAIIQRARQNSEEKSSPKSTPPTQEQKPVPRPTGPARNDSNTLPASTGPDRPNHPRGRQMYPPTGPHGGPSGRGPQQATQGGRQATGMLGHRLADNIQQRKGVAMGSVPAPLPIHDARVPPTGPAGDQPSVTSPSKVQTPTSAASTKFNVRAMEFKPNPAASTFTPGASSNSSPFTRGRSVSRATSPSAFFGGKKLRPIAERPSLSDQFNPIKRMRKECAESGENKHYQLNGGIPPGFKTQPTWDVAPGNEEKSYDTMFKSSTPSTIASQNRSSSNPQMPQQPHMPFQFPQPNPGMPPGSGAPHGPHLHPQQHHGSSGPPHFDDPHRMQMSASTSQIFPSPRLQHNYPSPMVPPAQLAYGQPMPQFVVNPNGSQPGHMRYPGGPQFMNPQGAMGAPMMVQQPSSGPYMGVPQGMAPYTGQVPMYSPNPGHAYPQHAPPQAHSSYPSPSRGAPMMMHQGSQPGQPPQPMMYMSPGQHGQPVYGAQQPGHMPPVRGNYQQPQSHFQSSPHQTTHYAPHQHRTPSSGYNQLPQIPPQGPAQQLSTITPGTQSSESTEETK